MVSNVKLGDLLTTLTDYHANGAYKKLKENVELLDQQDYAIMIRTTNFESENFTSNLKYISKSAYEFLEKSKVFPNDIIMNKIANAGSTYLMPDLGVPVSLAMNLFLLRINDSLANPTYIYLYLKLNESYVKSFANGSVTKTITKEAVRNLQIELPERNIQDAIVEQYFILSERIFLNRGINLTLEKLSQTLFQSWFVDFDPVIDNALAAGKDIPEALQHKVAPRFKAKQLTDFTPLPDDIRAFFPSEFEQTDEPSIGIVGWIPKGWNAGNFDKLMTLQRGFDLPKTQRIDGEYPLIAASGQDGTHSEFKVRGPGVTTGRSGKLGEVTFTYDNFWPLNTTLWVKEYLLSNPYHAYFFLNSLPLEEFNAGSAVPTLNRNHVHGTKCLLPDKKVTDLYQSFVHKWFEKINHNKKVIQHTETIRGALLPKLISGELTKNRDVA